jgi:hypothetical protein
MTLDSYIREQRERLRLRTIFSRYVSANYFVWITVGGQLLSYAVIVLPSHRHSLR